MAYQVEFCVHDLRRLAPGDRGPMMRTLAGRILTDLAAIEDEPSPRTLKAKATRSRRIAIRRGKLRRLHALAKLFDIPLQPAAVERAVFSEVPK
ncbi:hypothetical protein ACQ3G4_22455 [bacterium BS0013]